MRGLAPQDKRSMRESIVTSFFSKVGDKQVQHLDDFMENAEICNFSYKGINYNNSFTTGGNYRPLQAIHHEKFDAFLLVYSTLEMEMASLSALLTRLFRQCNSVADITAVLPVFLHRYMTALEGEIADDATVLYFRQEEIDELWEKNEPEINAAKVRAMRDQVFS